MGVAHLFCSLPQFCYGASKVQTQGILPALTCLLIRQCRNFFFFFLSFFLLLLLLLLILLLLLLLQLALQPTVGFGLSNNVLFFSYLPPTLSIFSLPALADLFLLPLSIFSWVFPFFSSLPRRYKWTRPFRWKTESGFCSCAITFPLHSTSLHKGSSIR